MALAEKPAVPFRVPAGLKLVRVDARSGTRASGGEGRVILEAFKPGTSPPEAYGGYGAYGVSSPDGPDGRPYGVSPDADRMITRPSGLW